VAGRVTSCARRRHPFRRPFAALPEKTTVVHKAAGPLRCPQCNDIAGYRRRRFWARTCHSAASANMSASSSARPALPDKDLHTKFAGNHASALPALWHGQIDAAAWSERGLRSMAKRRDRVVRIPGSGDRPRAIGGGDQGGVRRLSNTDAGAAALLVPDPRNTDRTPRRSHGCIEAAAARRVVRPAARDDEAARPRFEPDAIVAGVTSAAGATELRGRDEDSRTNRDRGSAAAEGIARRRSIGVDPFALPRAIRPEDPVPPAARGQVVAGVAHLGRRELTTCLEAAA
jgi:hypothetical protein